ncbi:MAG: response regulator [Bacteroidales bacterium]
MEERSSAPGPLVLVVEDDEDVREMYEVMLATSGYRVVSAVNGVEAVDKARELRPHVILMDLTLPTLDGWSAGRQLKSEPSTRHIPIVALSGNPVDEPGQNVFVSSLLKPCFPDDLVAEVKRLVGC